MAKSTDDEVAKKSSKAEGTKLSSTSKPNLGKDLQLKEIKTAVPNVRMVKSSSGISSSSTLGSSMASSLSHLSSSSAAHVVEDITKGPKVNTESQAKKLIKMYMRLQNRPYSPIQVL